MLEVEQLKQENEELKKLNEQLATYYPQENNELLKVKLENEDLKETIKKALEDFRGEYGTNNYDRLLIRASKHKIDISDFGEVLYGEE